MSAPQLLSEFKMGELTLKNRIALAPLTRGRSDASRIPNELMGTYYEQRASGGLLITEATAISEQGFGWRNAPGIYTKKMADGWKPIVERVHKKGGLIFLQLWHMGRQSHTSYQPEGKEIVSASAIAVAGETTTLDGTKAPYETPRALATEELSGVVEQYRQAAELSKEAGFDGVEIHGANGYLLDQFLQSVSNKRTDAYGGSMENRARLLIEVVEAVCSVYDSSRVALRLSPNGAFGSMGSEDNGKLFPYVAERLNKFGLAYLHVMDGLGFGFHNKCSAVTAADIRKVYDHPIMVNVGLTRDVAEGIIRSGAADLAAFGRLYISNPDLPERFANDWPLADPAPHSTWWANNTGAGYTDWPVYTPPEKKEEKPEGKEETPANPSA